MGYDLTSMLDYDKLKAKKPGGLGGLFAKKKIKKANAQIKAAVVDTNKDAKSTNKDGVSGVATGVENKDEANYVISDGTDDQNETQTVGGESETQGSEGTIDAATVQGISDQYETNTAAFAEMQSGLEGRSAQIAAEIQDNLTTMNDIGGILTTNMAEAEALGAELEGLQADSAGGGFSTSMAAAGGQNSAYSLNVPTGGNKPQGKGKMGGLISSGTQGAQQGGYAPEVAGGDDAGKTARTQEIYARLLEIENQNTSLQETLIQCADTATQLQLEFADSTQTEIETAESSNAEAEQASAESDKTAEVFNKISEYGMYTKVAGVATEAVGIGMTTAGTVMQGTGQVVKGTGTVMKGIGTGLKALAAGLLGFTFTAPAGTAVASSSTSVTAGGNVIVTTGSTITAVGKGVGTTGIGVQKVGKGVQLIGDATMTVGSAGTAVNNIAKGNILGAIGAGMSFLGSAASCLNNTAQFANMVGAAKDSFLGSIKEFSGKMDKWVSGFTGGKVNAGGAAQVLQKTGAAVTGWDQGGALGSLANVMGSSVGINAQSMGINMNSTDESGATTGTTDTTASQPAEKSNAYKDARVYGLSASAIEGKSDTEIRKMIADFNTGKINADGSKKTQG